MTTAACASERRAGRLLRRQMTRSNTIPNRLSRVFSKRANRRPSAPRSRRTWPTLMVAGLLAALSGAPAAANLWRDTFGQQWFYESVAYSGQEIAGTWWESALSPGETYRIAFEVHSLDGAMGLRVGGQNTIRIDRTGWHAYEFPIWNSTPRRMMFTALRNNTTAGVRNISVRAQQSTSQSSGGGSGSDSGSGGGSGGNWMPKGHYLTFSRERNLEREMLNYIDRPGSAPSDWHLGIARDMHDALSLNAVRGFYVEVPWDSIEVGDNRFNWQLLDANMRVARRMGLKFIVHVATRSFDGSNPMPNYFPNQYSVWTNGGRNSGFVAKLWDPWVYNRLIRLNRAIINRYGSDNAFGGLATSETAVGNLSGGNYSLRGYREAWSQITSQTQSALRNAGNGRLFWYLNFIQGGDDVDMRRDVRVNMLRNDVPHHALAIGAPDITPDQTGMPGSVNSYRIHTRRTMGDVEQFCHLQHVDQGLGGINRKSNRARHDFQAQVNRIRSRENQSWYNGPRAIFEFSQLNPSRNNPVQMHPDSAVGDLWHPRELFAFANRNFDCDYMFWHYRENVHNRYDQFWWEDIRPVILNNPNF